MLWQRVREWAWLSEKGGGGEGRERVRQSGRLSGVWTCLAACTKQRKYREMCRFSSYRRSQAALNSHLHLIHAFVIFASQSRCEAETGQQQTHKHGTGRCYALHPAQSAAAAACRYVYTRDDFFNYDFYSDVSYTLNLVKPWVCFPVALALTLQHCSLCLKKPCFLLPRMTSHSVRPIGRREWSVRI